MDMSHYKGEVILNRKIWRPHGQGTLTCYAKGGGPEAEDAFSWRYEGQFKEGGATGQGTTTYGEQYDDELRGQTYTGAHIDGDPHGQGTWYRHDGNTREDGTREDGTREYEGTWQEDCWIGNGTLYHRDGTISRNGKWVNGGSGEYEWQGETWWYEGDWDEDVSPHGWGVMYRPDRITVAREGWWQNGESVDGPPPGY